MLIELAGGVDRVAAVIDVGAFAGSFSRDAAMRHEQIAFLAVEPVPHLAEALRRATNDLTNYRVVEAAVGSETGRAALHIPSNGEFNFSSLLPLQEGRRAWREIALDEVLEIDVVRLDQLGASVEGEGDFVVKIDAQGADLIVLESFGGSLPRVAAGVIETAIGRKTLIYANSPTRAECVRYLHRQGFEVVAIEPEHPSNDDQNLVFVRRDLFPRAWPLLRVSYPLLVLGAWARYLPIRLRVRLRLRTRLGLKS